MNIVNSIASVVILAVTFGLYAPAGNGDEAGVRAAVDLYFRGIATNSADDLRTCFDPAAHVKLVRRGDDGAERVVAVPIDRAIASWTSAPPAPSTGRVVSLEALDGHLALVKADVVWQGRRYLDLLTLYRVNGAWRIVDKVFVDKGAQR